MKLLVADIIKSPFRDFATSPIEERKVEALGESIEQTGLWPRLQARKSPTVKGKYEIPYGHHELEAIKPVRPRSWRLTFKFRRSPTI